jgi:hypothetical protein
MHRHSTGSMRSETQRYIARHRTSLQTSGGRDTGDTSNTLNIRNRQATSTAARRISALQISDRTSSSPGANADVAPVGRAHSISVAAHRIVTRSALAFVQKHVDRLHEKHRRSTFNTRSASRIDHPKTVLHPSTGRERHAVRTTARTVNMSTEISRRTLLATADAAVPAASTRHLHIDGARIDHLRTGVLRTSTLHSHILSTIRNAERMRSASVIQPGIRSVAQPIYADSNDERGIPALRTYRMHSPESDTPYTFRRPSAPGLSAVAMQTQVRDIEHRVQTKVIHEIVHRQTLEKPRTVTLDTLLSPQLMQKLADRVFAVNQQRSAIEHYRRGRH